MKLMYICGMYVPSHGGAEISAYSLLKNLKDKFNFDILVITDERYKKTKDLKDFNQLKLYAVNYDSREKEIEKKILEFKPNLIITQLMWSDIALKLANKHSIPSIMRVCKVPIEISLAIGSEYASTAIISTSRFVKDYVSKHWKRESIIINPLVEIENYIIKKKEFSPNKNEFIFMFNPLERKGGLVFREIAKQLPSQKFGTVFGWSSLKDNPDSNAFSKEYIKRITESEGSVFDGSLPEYVNFNDCSNIKIFPPEDDSKKLYEKIKLLLVPSQWEEAFGRVAIEAMANGIPVIASDVAGLRDSVGDGGILLEKDNISKWVDEIKKLISDKEYFELISKREKEFVKNSYSEDEILNKTKDLIESIARK
jgi:glycosyltransferase involved in cell wall biosynthesis